MDSQRLRGGGVFLDLHIHVDRSLPGTHAHQLPADAPLGEMDFRGCHHPHIAVDARPRVPARVGVAAVVHPYGKHIVAFLQVGRQVVEERDVAVRAFAQQVAVEVHLAAVVDAFEVDVVAGCLVCHTEVLPVPGDAAGQVAGAACQVGGEVSLDRPVVWQGELPPVLVIEGGERHQRVVGEPEQPAVVEACGVAERHLCRKAERAAHAEE